MYHFKTFHLSKTEGVYPRVDGGASKKNINKYKEFSKILTLTSV